MNLLDYENNLLKSQLPVKRPFALISGILINIMLLLMFLLILVYLTFAPVPISGNSMLPTIVGKNESGGVVTVKGETVVVNKLFKTPAYKDIVVVDLYLDGKANKNDEARLIIKRAIAVAGDRFAFKKESASSDTEIALYIKRSGAGEYTRLNESSYIREPMTTEKENVIFQAFKPLPYGTEVTDGNAVLVGSGMVLCLGDNRNDSKDSRDHGLFKVSSLYGRYCLTLKEGTAVNWFFSQFYVTNNKSE